MLFIYLFEDLILEFKKFKPTQYDRVKSHLYHCIFYKHLTY